MTDTINTAPGAATDVADSDPHASHGYIRDKQSYLNRMKRIEGQARGISRMVDEE